MAWLSALALLAILAALPGCTDDDEGDGGGSALTEIGEPEGRLDLVAPAGYVEDGSTDPKVDWVSDFQKETGCEVSVEVAGTADEMVRLMRTGQYDGLSAPGTATARLVEGGDVNPVNVDLVPNYETVFEDLKDQPDNTFEGVHYGIPHGRRANLLIWNRDQVKPDPSSWGVILDPGKAAEHKGRISVYDDPIYIADAALYLKAHEPDLGIEDPYELDEEQFNAAVELLKAQRPNVGEYWSDAPKQISSFENDSVVVGTAWPHQYLTLKAEGEPVESIPASQGYLPAEDATGWSDSWMVSAEAEHPNCMYLWMDHIVGPEANAKVAAYSGAAPAQSKSCDLIGDLPPEYFGTPTHCRDYHADNPEFWERVHYWATPLADCGDDRGEVCRGYSDWVAAWAEIKAAGP